MKCKIHTVEYYSSFTAEFAVYTVDGTLVNQNLIYGSKFYWWLASLTFFEF